MKSTSSFMKKGISGSCKDGQNRDSPIPVCSVRYHESCHCEADALDDENAV